MSVLVVDDHPIFSAGLRELILSASPGVDVQLAKNFESACNRIRHQESMLVLLDIDLGGENGIDLISSLLELNKNVTVAMLSASESVADMKACVERGAVGYIPKSLEPETLLKAIDLLRSSGSYFPSNLLPHIVGSRSNAAQAPLDESMFTMRQLEVIECLKKGMSNKVIALELGITEGTVKLHVSAILERLNVSNRSEAIIALS